VGPSHADLPQAEATRRRDFGLGHRGAVRQKGWEFGTEPGATLDTVNGKSVLADVYVLGDPHYSGRASVPVLWDKKQRTIVNNESSEIIRMLNSAFDAFTDVRTDYYPVELLIIRSSCARRSTGSMSLSIRP
jgi:glutathionyl-hydroquinone reductase